MSGKGASSRLCCGPRRFESIVITDGLATGCIMEGPRRVAHVRAAMLVHGAVSIRLIAALIDDFTSDHRRCRLDVANADFVACERVCIEYCNIRQLPRFE